MSLRHQRHTRNLGIALALVALAAWQLPSFLSAERFRRRLEAGLEGALHRPVTFGSASFRLLPRPGFALQTVVVREDPAFGQEPFARVDQVECDIRWRSLWRARWEFSRVRLERPSLNVVRNAQGEWNVEKLLLQSGVVRAGSAPVAGTDSPRSLVLEADDGRLDFKVNSNKKPFAVTGLAARLDLDPARGTVRYQLSGNPLRSDLATPPPGPLELTGEWKPGADLGGSLNATLRTRDALLYNWVPLVTGSNPEIYGVLDADIHLGGSLRLIKIEGQARLTQLHRWEVLPPSDPMPFTIHFRGEFDRSRGRALVESADVAFAESHFHLTGAADHLPSAPELDLVMALERARLEDLLAVGRRLWGYAGAVGVSGRADGLMSVQGPWSERRYGGFLSAREVRLTTPAGQYPISDVALRIDAAGARLAPVKLTLAPRVELVAMGALYRSAPVRGDRRVGLLPRYEVRLSARAVDLREMVRLGRALGVRIVQGLDAQGAGNASLVLSGSAWPLERPVVTGRADVRAARLLIPGLTEPLNIPRARIRVTGDHLVADPVTAVLGTSVFTGRLEHQGDRARPWWFDVKASSLSVEQGALWFDVLGHRPPLALLDRIPGLSSLTARRTAASGLFSALHAQGRFETPSLTYRGVNLEDFRATAEVSGRVFRVKSASFRAGGGRGHGKMDVDLTASPARITGGVELTGAKLQSVASRLPTALRKSRGVVSGTAQFQTRGLTRSEVSASLTARADVRLRNVSFGEFDPLQAVARQARWGTLEPPRGEVVLPSASWTLEIGDRRVLLTRQPVQLEGAGLVLNGVYNFDGSLDLAVRADFSRLKRHWISSAAGEDSLPRYLTDFRLAGPLSQPAAQPEVQVSQATR